MPEKTLPLSFEGGNYKRSVQKTINRTSPGGKDSISSGCRLNILTLRTSMRYGASLKYDTGTGRHV
jgi:hypothetical protein